MLLKLWSRSWKIYLPFGVAGFWLGFRKDSERHRKVFFQNQTLRGKVPESLSSPLFLWMPSASRWLFLTRGNPVFTAMSISVELDHISASKSSPTHRLNPALQSDSNMSQWNQTRHRPSSSSSKPPYTYNLNWPDPISRVKFGRKFEIPEPWVKFDV